MEPSQTASSPVAVVGTVVLLLAFVVAAWSVVAGIVGNIRKDRRLVISSVYGLYGFAALAALASALVIYAFVTHDFSIRYVALTSDTSMPLAYKITAFWGGLDGSLLFWILVLGLFSTAAVRVNYQKHRDMIGYVVATIMVVQLFFMALLVFSKNPFQTYLTQAPIDGEGLNPLLQNYWMVIHPPMLYIGYIAATIPFAFAMGALASGRLDDTWIASVRSWMLICFFFLSVGLILGGRWAYEELGWGGYWAWDPVENAGFIPWFTATAFLHSAIIQEQRGMLKGWNLILVIATFFLTIMGTFWTRSGVVQSVHAFGEDNTMALQFVLFMMLIIIVPVGLVIYRQPRLAAKHQLESFASREFAFLLNNWVLLACTAFVIFATMWPTLTEAYFGERTTVGIPFFNKGMAPLGIALLLLAGIAPLLAWRKTSRSRLLSLFSMPVIVALVGTILVALFVPYARHLTEYTFDLAGAQRRGLSFLPAQWIVGVPLVLFTIAAIFFTTASIFQEFWRGMRARSAKTGQDPISSLLGLVLGKRRKYGGYIVHLGIVVLFIGFIGKNYDIDKDFSIAAPAGVVATDGRAQGAAWFELKGYRFHYEALREEFDARKKSTTAQVSVWKDGKQLETLYPAQWNFFKGGQMTTEVAIKEQLSEDVYLVLTGFKGSLASFKVYINPLVNWVWIGFVLFAFGCFVCMIPQRVVDMVSARPTTKIGKAADASAVIITFLAVTFACVELGVAQSAGVGEHDSQVSNAPAHMEGASDKFRPDDPSVPPAMQPVAAELMKQLVCMCGGCKREDIYHCKCSYAADERRKVLALLATQDVSTAQGRATAIASVRAAFKAEYGSEQVFVTPTSALPWLVPYVAIVVGLGLLLMVGRSWKKRPKRAAVAAEPPPTSDADDELKRRLKDELEDLDG